MSHPGHIQSVCCTVCPLINKVVIFSVIQAHLGILKAGQSTDVLLLLIHTTSRFPCSKNISEARFFSLRLRLLVIIHPQLGFAFQSILLAFYFNQPSLQSYQ